MNRTFFATSGAAGVAVTRTKILTSKGDAKPAGQDATASDDQSTGRLDTNA